MTVQHNLQAMNTNRMLGNAQKTSSKKTEKLSSGYRINKSADDAAGLSISEKMRKQIRGLTQATTNVEDGISAVQVAEGALVEVLDMLQRMAEIAIDAANGVNSDSDRYYMQMEIDQLSQEIDRIAENTKFNQAKLLNGNSKANKDYEYTYSMGAVTKSAEAKILVSADTGIGADIAFNGNAPTKEQNELARAISNQGLSVSTYEGLDGSMQYTLGLNGSEARGNYSVNITDDADRFEIVSLSGNVVATINLTADNNGVKTESGYSTVLTAYDLSAAESQKELYSLYDVGGNAIPANALVKYFNTVTDASGAAVATGRSEARPVYDALGKKLSLSDINSLAKKRIGVTQSKNSALQVSLHVGADGTSTNTINVNIIAMNSKGLGVNGLKIDGNDGTNAAKAVDVISAAVEKIAAQRATLGAAQNRLEHTSKNLGNVVENTTASESQIRDADMASTMVDYSNANILCQAGQSMLAQANQTQEGVLTLLN